MWGMLMTEFMFYVRYTGWYAEAIVENSTGYQYIDINTTNRSIKYSNIKSLSSICIKDIERLIYSHALVNSRGGLKDAIDIYEYNERFQWIDYDLYDAIQDVQTCMCLKQFD